MASAAEIRPWATPISGGTGRRGVLLCHGFTGSPLSLTAWADHLIAAGFRVEVPRLPGHGTRWQELDVTSWQDWYDCDEQAFHRLRRSCDEVHVAGLSMGGALALRLAERHPEDVSSLVLVNPSIGSADRRMRVVGALKHVVHSIPSIAGDIAKPGIEEHGYERTSLRGVHELTKLWRDVADSLDAVSAPVLMFVSDTDHVVDQTSGDLIRRGLHPDSLEVVALANSYHVATMDHDAEEIFSRSVTFFDEHGFSDEHGR